MENVYGFIDFLVDLNTAVAMPEEITTTLTSAATAHELMDAKKITPKEYVDIVVPIIQGIHRTDVGSKLSFIYRRTLQYADEEI